MKNLIMRYNLPAENSDFGWENDSLPIGNGYVGANVFGIPSTERVQITHNALVNPNYYAYSEQSDDELSMGGLNNLAEIYIEFNHNDFKDYERGLCLNNAISYCKYKCNGVEYNREYFASYPDKVVVMKFTASKQGELNFKLKPQIPFIKEYFKEKGDHGGKSGKITIDNDTIILSGKLEYFDIWFESQLNVKTDGKMQSIDDGIQIENASEAIIIFAADTNYKLCSDVFLNKDRMKKTVKINPHNRVCEIIKSAKCLSYEELLKRHKDDYTSLFERVELSLGDYEDMCVPDLLDEYRNGRHKTYLEELYFQYGRYLLISASRKGGLPANLQGIWNCHDQSPWGSGYWHNINVQMNYWPAFNTNLLECFDAYVDYYTAYRDEAELDASKYIKTYNPENYVDEKGECGWTIGTGGYPYYIIPPNGRRSHSGPGTGAFTTKLFWDLYDFSRDEGILKNIAYPAILGMSKFLTKTVKKYDDLYLVSLSASPEQTIDGFPKYYQTVGCAFDQQLIYENGNDVIKASKILKKENDKAVQIQQEQINNYAPVNIGWSGQIKEYREETFYGEIGEFEHRHISQLVGLYPGTVINSSTEAWIDAARVSLDKRGINTTGWALGHRLNAWTRVGDGNAAYDVLHKMLSEKTLNNLWDVHPPFQIDGNFGATAGVAEMLLQSHNDCIEILPALPDKWNKGTYKGLLARGNFEVSVEWDNRYAQKIEIKSCKGSLLKIKYKNISKAKSNVQYSIINGDTIELETKINGVYIFTDIPVYKKITEPTELEITDDLIVKWKSDMTVNVYRAVNSEANYTLVGEHIANCIFEDSIDFSNYETVTYKIKNVSDGFESKGIYKTINHATELQKDMYRNKVLAANYGVKIKL